MTGAPVPGYQAFWAEKRASLKSEYQVLIKQYPDADLQYRLLYKVICNIEDVAGCTPAAVGESAEWTAEDNRASYCKALSDSVLFSALHGAYTVALNDLKSLLKTSSSAGGTATGIESVKSTEEDGFKEVRRRKRHSTNEAAPTSKKPAAEAKSTPAKEVATRNFFAPLRATTRDTDSSVTEATTPEEAVPGNAGRQHSEAAETSSSSNHKQARFRWLHHPHQQSRIYGPLHCNKQQVSQSRPLL
jgi:hypothetical protein